MALLALLAVAGCGWLWRWLARCVWHAVSGELLAWQTRWQNTKHAAWAGKIMTRRRKAETFVDGKVADSRCLWLLHRFLRQAVPRRKHPAGHEHAVTLPPRRNPPAADRQSTLHAKLPKTEKRLEKAIKLRIHVTWI